MHEVVSDGDVVVRNCSGIVARIFTSLMVTPRVCRFLAEQRKSILSLKDHGTRFSHISDT